jgi:hypothetical protein
MRIRSAPGLSGALFIGRLTGTEILFCAQHRASLPIGNYLIS